MNICADCKKACGGCSWSRADPVTKKLLFEPVPGWTAEAVTVKYCRTYIPTYNITACPEFEPDNIQKRRRFLRRCVWCGGSINPNSERTKFCEKCAPRGPGYQKAINRMLSVIKKGGKHELP